jgi:predicted ATPase/class 3 adenylate cyclase
MGGLPSGEVTLMFSDIEGSTRLLARLGDSYVDALEAHRVILRRVWAACGGMELGTEGDGFFVVFRTAMDGVHAAASGQRELASHAWPERDAVRVRMGMHTGAPLLHDGSYVGMDVHRAARVAGAAHGGQVALTAATAELVAGGLPAGVALRSLGSHRLKDLPRAEHVFQLVLEGLENEFPAFRSLGATSRLPILGGPVLGRGRELAELNRLLRGSETRLVTLTGPGGSGKTRLAIELGRGIAAWFPEGVHFVPLATVSDATTMRIVIAAGMGVELPGGDPLALSEHLRHRRVVLVLDNLEQVSGAGEVVAELLAAAPGLVVVATSRRALHVRAEQEFTVPTLALPTVPGLDAAGRSPAVQLFVRQACRVRSSFELTNENQVDVVAICRQLDGMPLAIELAAARAKLLPPADILARLGARLDLRAEEVDRPSRHHSLREAIAWSYDLLSPEQRVLFRRLGVFAGGAALDAVEAVCCDEAASEWQHLDRLMALVDASLVNVSEEGDARVELLETIRYFALDRLEAEGEGDVIRERHARHYLTVADQQTALLEGNHYIDARNRLRVEHPNFREALTWAFVHQAGTASDRLRLGRRICAALALYWVRFARDNSRQDARRWLELAVAGYGPGDRAEVATCLAALSHDARFTGNRERAQESATTSVEIWRGLTDQRGLADALITLAAALAWDAPAPAARALYTEALAIATEINNPRQAGHALTELARLETFSGHHERALQFDDQAVAWAHDAGLVFEGLLMRWNRACDLRLLGRPGEAQQEFRVIVPPLTLDYGPVDLATLTEDYAAVLADLGEHCSAVRLFSAARAARERDNIRNSPRQEREIARAQGKSRAHLTAVEWNDAHEQGRTATLEVLLTAATREGDGAPETKIDR